MRPTLIPPARPPTEKKKRIVAKGIVIRSPVPSSSSDSTGESSPPRRVPGANGSGPSLHAHERLAPSAKEESEVDQPGPLHLGPEDLQIVVADKPVAKTLGPSCIWSTPSTLIVIDKLAAEMMDSPYRELDYFAIVVADKPTARRLIPPHDLQAGFSKRLQGHLYETMEVSCSSVQGDQLKGNQMEDASGPMSPPNTERPRGPMHDEGGVSPAPGGESDHNAPTEEDSANEIAHISVRPPSCTEMEEMLRRILHPLDADLPPSKMFETTKMVLFCSFASVCHFDMYSVQ